MSKDACPGSLHEDEDARGSPNAERQYESVVESLVTGRERRTTAGNRLSSLLEKEGDDELELLFAENEEEEDIEFEGGEENASDVELDSSTDEEDQFLGKGDDELAGEKELQKQDRLERQIKRKAKDAFKGPVARRKKVKIDPTATSAVSATNPKKKAERVSWVHTEADAPTRASSRKQTMQNREVVHQRLVESEQTRAKVMQHMEEAQKRKDASKPKALTQADRIEEAARTERRNAKSLNRWEESEKKRAEEQRAKLEALHNRQLTGPVVTVWSGLGRCVNGKIRQLGVKEIRAAGFAERPTVKEISGTESGTEQQSRIPVDGIDALNTAMPDVVHPHHLTEHSGQMVLPIGHHALMQQQITFAPPQGPYGFLDGIHAYAAMPMQKQRAEFTGTAHSDSQLKGYPETAPLTCYKSGPPAPMPAYPVAAEIEFTSRTLIALKEIDANAVRLPELQNSVLLKKPRTKMSKPIPELCAITMQPASFRDPKTGLAYANSYAYKEIQRLRNGGSRWSNLLDCYVGPVNSAAQGVPDRFWRSP